ncbi:hypothetical protein FHS09_000988 [Microbulbifer rhizosphaerae]|uniref:Uncharacterized protein n=1 Tax=Microbulbifer rhizosphaerae TaxID=1562603 RepID=A0A7W4WAJ8_9GAMM|nr:hypothetical protein [Microbulbifer rhizosphaerae]
MATRWRAITSSRLSVGQAIAFSCTVVLTITRSNSAGRTAALIVTLSPSFLPSLAERAAETPDLVASHGHGGLTHNIRVASTANGWHRSII